MPSETHGHAHQPDDTGARGHRARYLLVPLATIAAIVTALHAQGLAFTISAVVLWAGAAALIGTATMHEWGTCSLCTEPPRQVATADARARLARRVHSRTAHRASRILITVLLLHAVMPKPYLGPWWTAIPAAGFYLLVAVLEGQFVLRLAMHLRYHEECHVEWCRAGLRRGPDSRLRFRMWAGHHGIWIVAVMAPAVCALGLLAQIHDTAVLRAGYGSALLMLGVITSNIALDHAKEPCLRCARHLPSNGGEAADRRHHWLRLFHVTRFWLLGGALVCWMVSWALAGHLTAKVLICAAALTVVAWSALERVHAPVKPWCPWCRDDGGDEIRSATPDPSANIPVPA